MVISDLQPSNSLQSYKVYLENLSLGVPLTQVCLLFLELSIHSLLCYVRTVCIQGSGEEYRLEMTIENGRPLLLIESWQAAFPDMLHSSRAVPCAWALSPEECSFFEDHSALLFHFLSDSL